MHTRMCVIRGGVEWKDIWPRRQMRHFSNCLSRWLSGHVHPSEPARTSVPSSFLKIVSHNGSRWTYYCIKCIILTPSQMVKLSKEGMQTLLSRRWGDESLTDSSREKERKAADLSAWALAAGAWSCDEMPKSIPGSKPSGGTYYQGSLKKQIGFSPGVNAALGIWRSSKQN